MGRGREDKVDDNKAEVLENGCKGRDTAGVTRER